MDEFFVEIGGRDELSNNETIDDIGLVSALTHESDVDLMFGCLSFTANSDDENNMHAACLDSSQDSNKSELVAIDAVQLAYTSILDNCKRFSILSMKSKGIAYQLWPASTFLCEYIEANKDTLVNLAQDKFPLFLELGAGCALVSMVCASLGCCSIATDLPEVKSHIAANLALNQHYYSIDSTDDILNTKLQSTNEQQGLSGRVAVDCLTWGEDCGRFASVRYDVILVADCVYWEELFKPLLAALLQLTTNFPETIILLSQTVRRQHIEKRFFKRLHTHFFVDMVSEEKRDGERTRIYKAQRRVK